LRRISYGEETEEKVNEESIEENYSINEHERQMRTLQEEDEDDDTKRA
jgi:hypothetical protein